MKDRRFLSRWSPEVILHTVLDMALYCIFEEVNTKSKIKSAISSSGLRVSPTVGTKREIATGLQIVAKDFESNQSLGLSFDWSKDI